MDPYLRFETSYLLSKSICLSAHVTLIALDILRFFLNGLYILKTNSTQNCYLYKLMKQKIRYAGTTLLRAACNYLQKNMQSC